MECISVTPSIRAYFLPVAPSVGNVSLKRAREKAAVAEIVKSVFGTSARLAHFPDGAPRIEGVEANISVSHSATTAVLAVNEGPEPIGIDIEVYRPQLAKVAPRIFSEEELPFYSSSEQLLLTGWTLKEAVYKAARTPGLDFRRDIRLGIPATSPATTPGGTFLPYFISLDRNELLTVVKKNKGTNAV